MTGRILILDDDPDFRSRLSSLLTVAGKEVVCPEKVTPKAVAEALRGGGISEILADAMLGAGKSIGSVLSTVIAKHLDIDLKGIRIWIVSGAGETEDPVDHLRQHVPDLDIQDQWFGKPVSLDHLLNALGPAGSVFHGIPEDPDFDWLKMPVRVLSEDTGAVQGVNRYWKLPSNRPDPHDFIPFTADKKLQEFWGQIEAEGGSPAHHAFRLHTFRYRSTGRLIQVAEQMPEILAADLDKLFDQIAKTLSDHGFRRCRLYQLICIPGCPGLGRLTHSTHGHQGKEYPIGEEHRRRINGLIASELPGKLIYFVRNRDDEIRLNDPSLDHWRNEVRGVEVESWAEVPVLVRSADGSWEPRALLTFDRLGETGVLDGMATKVEKKHVEKIQETLRRMLKEVAHVLRETSTQAELRWRQCVDNKAEAIQAEKAVVGIAERLLTVSMEHCDVSSGVILVKGFGEDIVIHSNCDTSPDIVHLRALPRRCSTLPVWKCWDSGKDYLVPDWKNSADYTTVSVLPDEDWAGVDPNLGLQLRDLLLQRTGSVIALPIMAGTEICGVISLRHKNPWFFTADKVDALKGLIDHSKWMLAAMLEKEIRHRWEATIAHEMRSDAMVLMRAADALNRNYPEIGENSKTLQRRTRHLWDLGDNMLTMLSSPESITTGDFGGLADIIAETLAYSQPELAARDQVVTWKTPPDDLAWDCRLNGVANVLARVLRVLLDNASRHGESGGEIRLSCGIADGFWHLTIDNPGELAEGIPDGVFYRNDGNRRIDIHVGLAAGRAWVAAHGGRLQLRNSPHEPGRIEARIDWPLAKECKA